MGLGKWARQHAPTGREVMPHPRMLRRAHPRPTTAGAVVAHRLSAIETSLPTR